jgi:hypothetical protein
MNYSFAFNVFTILNAINAPPQYFYHFLKKMPHPIKGQGILAYKHLIIKQLQNYLTLIAGVFRPSAA